jgi:magnesium chelatase family protein
MLSRVRTAALWGLEAFPVDCEMDVGPGLPGFILVGLPDPSVREARDPHLARAPEDPSRRP